MKIPKLTKEIWLTCGKLLYNNNSHSEDLSDLLSSIDELMYILKTELHVKPSTSAIMATKTNKATFV